MLQDLHDRGIYLTEDEYRTGLRALFPEGYQHLSDEELEDIIYDRIASLSPAEVESLMEGFGSWLKKAVHSAAPIVTAALPAVATIAGTAIGGPLGGAAGGLAGSLAAGAIGKATHTQPNRIVSGVSQAATAVTSGNIRAAVPSLINVTRDVGNSVSRGSGDRIAGVASTVAGVAMNAASSGMTGGTAAGIGGLVSAGLGALSNDGGAAAAAPAGRAGAPPARPANPGGRYGATGADGQAARFARGRGQIQRTPVNIGRRPAPVPPVHDNDDDHAGNGIAPAPRGTSTQAATQLMSFLNSVPLLQSILSSIATGSVGTALQIPRSDGSETPASYVEILEALKQLTENAIGEADNAGFSTGLQLESEDEQDSYIESLIEDVNNYENALLPNYDAIAY